MLEMFMDIMDAIYLFCCRGLLVGLNLLMGVIVLWGIYLIFKVLFSTDDATSKTTDHKSRPKSNPIVCDWSGADEAQGRAVRAGARAHEDCCRLHDMAVRDVQEAHTMACDMHDTAVEMHNDFVCGGCDPWF